ncbi:hypothetical protein [Rubrivivax gelatinosus]|uniref:Uncharacterized protein n=1 Tax=Rubrivivax gelatinosus TaxID=28068 RepID=A0A4V2SHK1_RUBGE|nr:hypothetical protein [Rubrivivax gelatinosus]MBK1688951.1 hypothetical protein [Rubrivivax gelatinosus]TCP05448.1 hypothetical protein EV684_101320 [Rubrivivax gelatinosus]
MTTLAVLPPAAAAATGATPPVQAGYGVSLTDLSAFNASLARAGQPLQAQPTQAAGEGMKLLFRPLEQINGEAAALSRHARVAMQAGADMTPGEMVMLTVRCQEFLFHSQLTANVANRTSDGLQQLFRQQA